MLEEENTFGDTQDEQLVNEIAGLKEFPIPDPEAVIHGCKRIKEIPDNEESCGPKFRSHRVALMSILARIKEDNEEVHDHFRYGKEYDAAKINNEVEMSLSVSGPRYCTAINSIFDGQCEKDCPYWMDPKVNSPIKIKGDEYIETENTGFWEVTVTKSGPKPRVPSYADLLKKFQQIHSYMTLSDSGIVYTYNGEYWEEMDHLTIKGFAQTHLNPKPKESQRVEFLKLVLCTNLKPGDWFQTSTEGLINLRNGVLDIEKDLLLPHDQEYGFKYILPYSYDQEAECPTFNQFLYDVCDRQQDVGNVLTEFMGYSMANGPCYAEKALIMYGEGSNGKSVFMDTLKKLAGDENYAALSLTALNKDTKRYMIDGKLFNIGEETNVKALSDSEVFKTMVTGGEIDVKRLYAQDYTIKNTCKLIMACNELPKSSDRSDGLYRRMILVPFTAKFSDALGNRDPKMRDKLYGELPGILNLAIKGYKRLKKNNWQFSDSTTLSNAIEEYKIENDNVMQFYQEYLEYTGDDDDYIYKTQMYDQYKRFCEETGNYAVGGTAFHRSIKSRVGVYKESRRLDVRTNSRKRVVLGLKYLY